MDHSLAVYLHDHMAGSKFAVELLESLRDRYQGESLGKTAGELVVEIEKDRAVLERVIQRVGRSSPDLKTGLAWVTEKLARLKLGSGTEYSAGTLEAVETLTLGIQGKIALWKSLAAIEASDARVRGEDYQSLIERAMDQFRVLDARRIEVARVLFAGAVPESEKPNA